MALAPLAGQWSQLSPEQQRNWMAVSRRYPRMTPGERQILQDRMTEWAALTPSQRNQARFNFNAIKSSLSAEQRRAKWEEYRNLPLAERARLAKKHHMPYGTAPALRPPLPGRLVKPPVAALSYSPMPAMQPSIEGYDASHHISRALIPADRNTLLPRALLEPETGRRPSRRERQ
jgi:hypothetical protein